jgi:hypothetical protein
MSSEPSAACQMDLSTIPHSRCAISQIAVRKIVAHKRSTTDNQGAER